MWTYDMRENYFHCLDEERMNTWRWTGSVIVNFLKRSRFPQFASDLKWKKEDRKGGRKGKEDRSRRKDPGEARKYTNTNVSKETNFINKHLIFFTVDSLFKGEEDRSLRIKRRVVEGAAVVAVSLPPRTLISGFFFDGITTCAETPAGSISVSQRPR